MAVIFVNGCFDLLHEGHRRFLAAAKMLGQSQWTAENHKLNLLAPNKLIVAVNSDYSCRLLKEQKWGKAYPHQHEVDRAHALQRYADEVHVFSTEHTLLHLIKRALPCIIVKGPDYAGQRVCGDLIAPVLILDTPEPEAVKQLKIQVYGQQPQKI